MERVNLLSNETERRKAEHIRICMEKDVQAKLVSTGFEDVHFVHKALPEINMNEINLKTEVFDHEFSAPILVGAITGGTAEAAKINEAIAEAVEELGLGMGVGSQRAAIENPKLVETYAIARKKAPTAFLMANIGGAQLVQGYTLKEIRRAIEMIDADALAIHLNPLQEAIQPEGETKYRGLLEKIREVAENIDVPLIVKETGAGIAAEEAKKLEEVGVSGIDVAGAGGTSWAAVEYFRAKDVGNSFLERLGESFWNWGIPTVVSLVEIVNTVNIPVIASGGIRNGVQIAKALALGASLASFSSPVLKEAVKGSEQVKQLLSCFIGELRNAMFLVGAKTVQDLRKVPVVITGKTAEWLRIRGFEPEKYGRRKLGV